MEFINILGWYGPLAIGMFLIGVVFRLLPVIRGGSEYRQRSETAYPPRKKKLSAALWDTAIKPFLTFGIKANRFWFAGFLLFHIGMLILLGHSIFAGAYAAMHVVTADGTPQELPAKIFEDAEHVPEFMVAIRVFSLVAILAGILILVISKISLNTIGMRSAIDGPTKRLRIRTLGVQRLTDVFLLLLILAIVVFGTLTANTKEEDFLVIHILLTLTLLALTPYTTLFHFIYGYWAAIVYGVRKRMDGTVA